MSRLFGALPRKFFSISWPVGLLVILAVVAASCSGSNEQAQLLDPAEIPDTPTAPAEDEFAGEAPDTLAFADAPITLRVSVPNLPVATPYALAETDAVQVLIADLLTDGLTRRNTDDGSIEGAIAESWTTSDDGLTWTFQLRDATFSNGSPVRADDVVASLTRVAQRGIESVSGPNLWPIVGWTNAGDPAETAPADGADLGDGVDASETADTAELAGPTPDVAVDVSGIQADGDDQVVITLSEPFAPLAEVLAGVSFGILPEDTTDTTSVGSAVDFVLEEQWADGMRFVGEQVVGEVSTIEVLLDPQFTMLRAGETDLGIEIGSGELDGVDLASDPTNGLTVVDVQRSATSYFGLNASLAPFDDPLIRQAVVRAIDVEALREAQFPNAAALRSFIPEQVAGDVVDACGANCELDREQAATLVQASPSRDVEITVDFIAPEAAATDGDVVVESAEEQMALAIVEDLAEVGLTATAVGHTPGDYAAAAANGELGIFRFGSVSTALSPEASIALQFHSEGGDNVTATAIDRVDELIDQARLTEEADDRAGLYRDAERVLFAEAVVVPLVEFRHEIAFGRRLLSAGLEPDGSLNLTQIEFDTSEAPLLQGE